MLLPDCRSAELIIVEGESAAGAVRNVCDRQRQQIVSVGGKMPALRRLNSEALLKNQRVRKLFEAIRSPTIKCEDFQRIVLLCDADADGLHSRASLAALLCVLCPQRVAGGQVVAVLPPLFMLQTQGSFETALFRSKLEVQKYLQRVGRPEWREAHLTHFKGIASMPANLLYESCVCPLNRTQVTLTTDCLS